MFKANKFITENSFISRGNTTHWFGRHTVTCRFASILIDREGINCKLLKVKACCKQRIRKEKLRNQKESIQVVL